jgi:predicted RNA-binding protein YlxR (DUF448 family)
MPAQQNHVEFDRGPQSRGLERYCIAMRAVRPVETMMRFVIAPSGEAVADLKRNLPGRGVWVTATRTALERAIKTRAFARSFRRDIRIGDDLMARTEALLEKAALDAMAIARKAGLVVMGFGKVDAALAHDTVIALVHAAEAAPDGVKKLDAALRHSRKSGSAAVIRILSMAQLDLALGRPNVVHAALLAGPASEKFVARLRRLERFRSGQFGESGDQPETRQSRPTSVS